MARLRAPDGCPWDRRQSLESLRAYLIEETYEVLEALDDGDPGAHREELGDLLFQVVFQARIREEEGHFDAAAVADGIREKLERRHPHVFGDAVLADAEAVAQSWHAIKAQEKRRESALDGIPRALPALLRAERLGAKAARVGFDWPDVDGVLAKLAEEQAELAAARAAGDADAIHHEVGDLLLTMASLARHLGVDPEAALEAANHRFEQRFRGVERRLSAQGQAMADADAATLDAAWEAVKRS
ncbi:MAG: nucleoside triphosphate pyrophosphohydrolase [Myxococcales bacterium]|nr:nucleoside triphosphate pyrophosphohydrolase [Myxococcales bacterium]